MSLIWRGPHVCCVSQANMANEGSASHECYAVLLEGRDLKGCGGMGKYLGIQTKEMHT